MPTYDYRCEANGQVYEVRHAMALRPKTWGELREACALAEGRDDCGRCAGDQADECLRGGE